MADQLDPAGSVFSCRAKDCGMSCDNQSQQSRGYRGGSPTAVQDWRPCPLLEPSSSHPISVYTIGICCVFCICVCLLYFSVLCVLCVLLQYFDTVGWVFWPVKTVTRIIYTVLVETLNHAQSITTKQQSVGLVSQPIMAYVGHLCWQLLVATLAAASSDPVDQSTGWTSPASWLDPRRSVF